MPFLLQYRIRMFVWPSCERLHNDRTSFPYAAHLLNLTFSTCITPKKTQNESAAPCNPRSDTMRTIPHTGHENDSAFEPTLLCGIS